ncbi:MAG: hypothetical protein JSV44_11795 [Candidatus Zixiibacteriota bacterium]|nr:MAG: hypothetical protein JSV44_11795 [candidate division Zixibacteria bacterium]
MNLRGAVLLAGVAIVLAFKPVGSQELIWSANYGGQFNDNGYAGQRAGDGGYILLGSTYSFGSGGFDFYLLKVSPAGDTLWTKTFGGAATDIGYDVAVTADGGFIMVGSTRSLGAGGKDVYLIRADSTGAVLWEKNYGGSGQDEGRSIRQTSDNGFIICGTTSSYGSGYDDVYFIRTDSIGDTVWTTTVGGGGGESGSAVRQTADGGFIAVGSTGSFGDGYSSLYAIRLNANGDSVWTAVYGGGGADFGYALEITPDQGFIFSGGTASFSAGYTDAYLVKTDAGGNVEWEKSYGGAFDDRAYAVMRAMDGGYLLVGTTESFGAAMIDLYLIKTNPVGDTVWTRRYGGSQSDYGQAVFRE